MEIKINKKDSVYFVAYPKEKEYEGEYEYRRFLRKPIDFSFCVQMEENMNWEKIENQIRYFIENIKEILTQSKQVIKMFHKTANWEYRNSERFDLIQLPTSKTSEDLFIIEPWMDYDPYSEWSIHFYDNNGPKIRQVVRNNEIIE
jgi:hypothetical protein